MRARRLRDIVAALGCGAAAIALAAPAAAEVTDSIAQRVQACTPCHGKDGIATSKGYLPRIAGKPAGYLYNQLLNFREGRRSNATMNALVENLSDAYLMEIATHFASVDLPYPPPTPHAAEAQQLSRGEALVKQGDAARDIPACVQCHSSTMTGYAPAVPGLLGLPNDYLLAQLGAWRTGQRRAAAPDCMGDISHRLSAQDLVAVATYLSRQPVPPDSKPATRIPLPLPLDCGSIPR